MRNRILILFAAFSLFLAAPLLAQDYEEPQDETQIEHSAELQTTDDSASASAELTATNDEQPEMESDVDAEANTEFNVSDNEDRELPQTAGFLPLLALLGLGSLATALGLRAVRRK